MVAILSHLQQLTGCCWNPPHELKPGMNVLVWGASGGIGSMAVQICRGVGANAIGIISDDEKFHL